jgi:Mlc titration factor MtfA (ptsG expression regulator)
MELGQLDQLVKWTRVFVAEKHWEGCEGLVVTDDMKWMIASMAGMMVLAYPDWYFDRTSTILIYPTTYVARVEPQYFTNTYNATLGGEFHRAGQTIYRGPVVLNWRDIHSASQGPNEGHHLVVHEFAHQLDQLKGQATGAPLLRSTEAYQQWAQVLSREFELLQRQLAQGLPTLFDSYAATNPAEFFAVISEVFFEQPDLFAAQHQALYQQLRSFYAMDPLSWVHTHPINVR